MIKELLSRINKFLRNKKIPYAIIGGQAVLIYAEPRFTRDIDITLLLEIDKIIWFIKELKKIGIYPIPENPEDFVKKTMVLPCEDKDTKFKVDFILAFTPYEIQAIKKRVKKVKVLDGFINFISPEDLIIHKIFSNRPRDIDDVRSIINSVRIDVNYIKNQLREFERTFPEQQFLSTFLKLLKECKIGKKVKNVKKESKNKNR